MLSANDAPDESACFTDSIGLATDNNIHTHNHWAASGTDIEPTAYLSSPLNSSTRADTSSLSVDQTSNAWGSWTDLELFDFGGNTYDPSWLVGRSFDINVLTSSISAAASPWVYGDFSANLTQSQLNERSDGGHNIEESIVDNNVRTQVRTRWHTRPLIESAHPYALKRPENPDRVDEAYRAGLSSRLRPSPHDDVLPSADFLVCTDAIRVAYLDLAMINQADIVIEYMHQAVLCQIPAHIPHRSRPFVSTFFRERTSPPIYLLSGCAIRGISRRCCSWQRNLYEIEQGNSGIGVSPPFFFLARSNSTSGKSISTEAGAKHWL